MTQLKMAFFTQPNCVRCPDVKKMVEEIKLKKEIEVSEYNTMTDDGMLEAVSNNLMSTPSIVLKNGSREIKLVGDIDKESLIASIDDHAK